MVGFKMVGIKRKSFLFVAFSVLIVAALILKQTPAGAVQDLGLDSGNATVDRISVPGETILIYQTTGTTTFKAPLGVTNVRVLAVGGGGGGGAGEDNEAGDGAGGGGAGGLAHNTTFAVTPGASTTVVVGGGGGGSSVNSSDDSSSDGSGGGDSHFGSITGNGGGGGGGDDRAGINGGSGGGGGGECSAVTTPGGTGIVGKGNNGGGDTDGINCNRRGGGGGGGAGAVGSDPPSSTGGAGGAGTQNNITSTNVFYAGGGAGGGGTTSGGGGAGGSSIGGAGGAANGGNGTNGTVNTGSGGGGGGSALGVSTTGGDGGSGGSGVVIVRFATQTGQTPGGVESNLGLWLKADAGTSSSTDNTAITSWGDQSGNWRDVSQSSAGNQPTFKNNASDNINFNPVVKFDGSSDFMDNSTGLNHNVTTNGEDIFAIVLPNSLPAGYSTPLSLDTNASTRNITTMRYGLDYLEYQARNDAQPWETVSHSAPTAGTPQIANGSRSTSGATSLQWNGKEVSTGILDTFSTHDHLTIGARREAGSYSYYFNGSMAEVIFYNKQLSSTERAMINSYLALKYGITLDQSVAQNYVDSGGSTVWNAATNGAYKYDIAGIGRDDLMSLNQKQSMSVNSTSLVTIGNGGSLAATNTANANTFSADKTFMIWAHDNTAINAWDTSGAPTNFSRVARTWRVTDTNSAGNTTVAINVANTASDIPNAINGYYLLRDSDNDGLFTDETPVLLHDDGTSGDLTAGDNHYSVNGTNFADGEKFTIATFSAEYKVIITPVDNLTGEDGDTGSFKVSLGAQPTANVTIALSSSNTDEGTVPASITITPANWNNPDANVVTVTGVNDTPAVADGSVPYTIITGDVTSADTNFDALAGSSVDDVAMFNQNDDAPGVKVTIVDNTTGEDGSTATVRFELLSDPSSNVTIPLSLSDTSEGSLGGVTSIVITPANWNQPQNNEVTITGVDDVLADGNVHYQLVTGDPTSVDSTYDALTASDVADPTLTNADNDTAGITITESGGSTNVTEGGATDTFSIVLNTQLALGNVVAITVTPSAQLNLGSGLGVAVQLTFNNSNWNQPQTVTVTAHNDIVVEGNHTGQVTVAVDGAATTEPVYPSLNTSHITVTIVDDDQFDGDSDGVINGIEEAAPGGGDGNGDGSPDSEQANVTSFVSEVTGTYVVIEADTACQITSVGMKTEASHTIADSAFDYPAGLMNFTLNCGTPGYTATIKQYYYGTNNNSFVLRKHNPTSGAYFAIPGSSVEQTTMNSQVVTKATYQAADGGVLDTDGAVNGVIVDPAGLAQNIVGAPSTGIGGTAYPHVDL